MKILAIETSTPSASIAISEDTDILWECTLNSGQTHSETLIANIQHGLKAANIKKEELGCIAIAKGPGSFTGLRIGMTTAKTLAFSLNIPIISISSLLAYTFNFSYMKVPLCPMLDARKNEVYAAVYEYGGGKFTIHLHDGAYALGQVLKSCPDGSVLFGNGAELYKDLILSYDRTFEILPSNLAIPRASSVAILSYWKFLTGEYENTKSLIPEYCRKSEAEIHYKNK